MAGNSYHCSRFIMLKKLFNSTARVVIILVLLVVLVVLNLHMWNKDHKQEQLIINLQKELTLQQQENAKIAQVNKDLHQKIDSLKQGSREMIEEEARNSFNMVGPGETFYHFEDKGTQGKTAQ